MNFFHTEKKIENTPLKIDILYPWKLERVEVLHIRFMMVRQRVRQLNITLMLICMIGGNGETVLSIRKPLIVRASVVDYVTMHSTQAQQDVIIYIAITCGMSTFTKHVRSNTILSNYKRFASPFYTDGFKYSEIVIVWNGNRKVSSSWSWRKLFKR